MSDANRDEDDEAEPQATSDVRSRAGTPVAKPASLRCLAHIPEPPEAAEASDVWHFGYPMTPREIGEFLDRYRGGRERFGSYPDMWPEHVAAYASCKTGWPGIRHVFVEGVKDVPGIGDMTGPEWQTEFSLHRVDGKREVTFLMICSTIATWFMAHKPWQEQLDELTRLFEKEPLWMKDVMPKREAWRLYQFEY
ncbi:uncharacterized protein SCHCODRAFT_02743934 [Schizophyllum commune H4-8]|nr:uncharacterized protein SCHCODRAFT_02743934 [Schizophyllum commune H4-8]KAI5897563.1 hypothetical protein SCHCODRAFT_02743934 [Schizophyllum commune H4-8]